MLRIRDLGISADRQRDLLQALVDRVETVDGRIAALEACQGDILGALDVIWQWREQQSRSALSGQAAPPEDLANLHDRQEALRVRLARFEGALADLREELDGLRGGPQRSRAWPKA